MSVSGGDCVYGVTMLSITIHPRSDDYGPIPQVFSVTELPMPDYKFDAVNGSY